MENWLKNFTFKEQEKSNNIDELKIVNLTISFKLSKLLTKILFFSFL